MRQDQDKIYMQMAEVWATSSYAKRKQVGCLIVKDRTIISDGYNGQPKGLNNCCEHSKTNETLWTVLHAESNAITKLARSTQSGEGATLYTTLSPCKDCAKLIVQAGIARVVFKTLHSEIAGIILMRELGVKVDQLK